MLLPPFLRKTSAAVAAQNSLRPMSLHPLRPRKGPLLRPSLGPQTQTAGATTIAAAADSHSKHNDDDAMHVPMFEPPLSSSVPLSMLQRARFLVLECAVLGVSATIADAIPAALFSLDPLSIACDPVMALSTSILASGGGYAAVYFALTQLMQRKGWSWMKLPPPVSSCPSGTEYTVDHGAVRVRPLRPRANRLRVVLVLFGGLVLYVVVDFVSDDSTELDVHL
jgi:hypothetical protein